VGDEPRGQPKPSSDLQEGCPNWARRKLRNPHFELDRRGKRDKCLLRGDEESEVKVREKEDGNLKNRSVRVRCRRGALSEPHAAWKEKGEER